MGCSLLAILIFLFLTILPTLILADCTCDESEDEIDKSEARKYKIIAIVTILTGSTTGVFIPLLGKFIPALSPERDLFFIVKAFAAGVILATGFIHVLPDSFENLTSPCLNENPWGKFPFAGFAAMVAGIGTLMVDSYATSYLNKRHHNSKNALQPHNHENDQDDHSGRDLEIIHNHGVQGHAHGSDLTSIDATLRRRVIAQVLELGIVAHSVVIGISLGANQSPSVIKPLVAALTFHQFFEGVGLGGSISQANLKSKSIAIMAVFFTLTTPVGIGIGMGISSVYKENSPTALITEGLFNGASAGILIYMALVDFLAADFMNPKLQQNGMLMFGSNVSLLLGAGLMSLIAKWA